MFLITYIHLETIWSDFMKIDFFRFFDPQKIFFTYICGRNSDFPAEISQKMFGIHFLTSKPFSKKMADNRSDFFQRTPKSVTTVHFPENAHFEKVLLCCFCCVLGYHDVIFSKV